MTYDLTTPKRTLLQCTDDYVALSEIIEQSQNPGELDNTLEAWLSEVDRNLAIKVDHYQLFMDDLGAKADRLRARAQALTDAARTIERVSASLKARIKMAMTMMDVQELSGEEFRFQLQRGPSRLVLEEKSLPEEYRMIVTTVVPDKERISEGLKKGAVIPGARIEQVQSLRTYGARQLPKKDKKNDSQLTTG